MKNVAELKRTISVGMRIDTVERNDEGVVAWHPGVRTVTKVNTTGFYIDNSFRAWPTATDYQPETNGFSVPSFKAGFRQHYTVQ